MFASNLKDMEDIKLHFETILMDLINTSKDNLDEINKFMEHRKKEKIEISAFEKTNPEIFFKDLINLFDNSKIESVFKVFEQLKLKFEIYKIYKKIFEVEKKEKSEIRELLCNLMYYLRREIVNLLDFRKDNTSRFQTYKEIYIKTVNYTFILVKDCMKIKEIKLENSLNFTREITLLTFKLYKHEFNDGINDEKIMKILVKMGQSNEKSKQTLKTSLIDFIEDGSIFGLKAKRQGSCTLGSKFINLIIELSDDGGINFFKEFVVNNLKEEYYTFKEKIAKKFVKILFEFLKGNYSLKKKLLIVDFILLGVKIGFPDDLSKPYCKLHLASVLDNLSLFSNNLQKFQKSGMDLFKGMDQESKNFCRFCGENFKQVKHDSREMDLELYDHASKSCFFCSFFCSAVPEERLSSNLFEEVGALKRRRESYKSCCSLIKGLSASLRTIIKLLIVLSNRESKDRLRSSLWGNLTNLISKFRPLSSNKKINSHLEYKLNDKYHKIRENSMKILACFDPENLNQTQISTIHKGVECFLKNFYEDSLSEKIKLSHLREYQTFVKKMKEKYFEIENEKNKELLFGIYTRIFLNTSERIKEGFKIFLTVLLYPSGNKNSKSDEEKKKQYDFFCDTYFKIFDLEKINQKVLEAHNSTMNFVVKQLIKKRDFDVKLFLTSLLSESKKSIQGYFLIQIFIKNLPKSAKLNKKIQSEISQFLEKNRDEILMKNKIEERNSYTIKYLFDILQTIVEIFPQNSSPFQTAEGFTEEILEQFWDYPTVTYSSTCSFIFEISCALKNIYKLDTLLVKSMSFIEVTTKEVISGFESEFTMERGLIEPIESVVKTISEIWRLLEGGFKNRGYVEKLNENYSELLKINDSDLRKTLYLSIYELNFDFDDEKVIGIIQKNITREIHARETMTLAIEILREERKIVEKKSLKKKVTLAYRQKSDFLLQFLKSKNKKLKLVAMELVMVLAMERELALRDVFMNFFSNLINQDPEISNKALACIGEIYRFEPRLSSQHLERGILINLLKSFEHSDLSSETLLELLWGYEKKLNIPRESGVARYTTNGLINWIDFPFNKHCSVSHDIEYKKTRNCDFIILVILSPHGEIKFSDLIKVTKKLIYHCTTNRNVSKMRAKEKILRNIVNLKIEHTAHMLLEVIAENFQNLYENRSKGSKTVTKGFYYEILDSSVHEGLDIMQDKFKTSKEVVSIGYSQLKNLSLIFDQINEISKENLNAQEKFTKNFIEHYEDYFIQEDFTYLDFNDIVKKLAKESKLSVLEISGKKRTSREYGDQKVSGIGKRAALRRRKRVRRGMT